MLKHSRGFLIFAFFTVSCASVPEERVQHDHFNFPESGVFPELPSGKFKNREYQVLGWVRSKAHWPTLHEEGYNEGLCRNYYNKTSRSLLKEAKKVGADAVIQVRSVVFMLDGRVQEFPTPECSDDGAEGEILLRGIAIKFKPLSGSDRDAPPPAP